MGSMSSAAEFHGKVAKLNNVHLITVFIHDIFRHTMFEAFHIQLNDDGPVPIIVTEVALDAALEFLAFERPEQGPRHAPVTRHENGVGKLAGAVAGQAAGAGARTGRWAPRDRRRRPAACSGPGCPSAVDLQPCYAVYINSSP